jgi:photosystem II Psb27 protein
MRRRSSFSCLSALFDIFLVHGRGRKRAYSGQDRFADELSVSKMLTCSCVRFGYNIADLMPQKYEYSICTANKNGAALGAVTTSRTAGARLSASPSGCPSDFLVRSPSRNSNIASKIIQIQTSEIKSSRKKPHPCSYSHHGADHHLRHAADVSYRAEALATKLLPALGYNSADAPHIAHVNPPPQILLILSPCCSAARRTAVVARAQHQQPQPQRPQHAAPLSRRQTGAALAALAALVAAPAPARAGLFGDGGVAQYTDETAKIIADINTALGMEGNDPAKEDTMKALRQETITWVSRYRRNPNFSGRPSFSNLYSAINALDGQLNSFGMNSRIPTKRLERIQKEVTDADRQLQRGR